MTPQEEIELEDILDDLVRHAGHWKRRRWGILAVSPVVLAVGIWSLVAAVSSWPGPIDPNSPRPVTEAQLATAGRALLQICRLSVSAIVCCGVGLLMLTMTLIQWNKHRRTLLLVKLARSAMLRRQE